MRPILFYLSRNKSLIDRSQFALMSGIGKISDVEFMKRFIQTQNTQVAAWGFFVFLSCIIGLILTYQVSWLLCWAISSKKVSVTPVLFPSKCFDSPVSLLQGEKSISPRYFSAKRDNKSLPVIHASVASFVFVGILPNLSKDFKRLNTSSTCQRKR